MDNKEEILREELKELLSLPTIDYVRVLKRKHPTPILAV